VSAGPSGAPMMKPNPIETTPGNKFIILQDDRKHSDVNEVARWSVERADWIRKDGEPSRIVPTHWLPLDHLPRPRQEGLRRSWPFGTYARYFAIAGLAMLFVASFLSNLAAARVSAEAMVRTEIAQVSDEQNDALEQERRRGDALARELASAREELETRKAAAKAADDAVQAAQALAIEHQQVSERERQLGEVLARQLASAQKAIETLMARVTALTDARTEAEKALQAAQASVAEQRQALEQERRRGDALARDSASAREELEMRKAAAKAADDAVQAAQALAIEHQQVGERERQLGEVLARQLASAQKEVETLTARIAAMSAARTEAGQTLQDAQASATHQRQALEQERERAAADTKGSVGKGDRTATPAREPQVAEIDDRTEVAAPPPPAIGEQIALWVRRGEDFTAAGDVVSARLVFQRAAETGDAKAALMLAETYDPNVLGRLRAKGVAPDIAMARLWYEKAKDLGSPEAQRRLERLDQPN
jgi:hypothetical protein